MTDRIDYDEARGNLIGFCMAAVPNEVAFDRADRLADRFETAVLQRAEGQNVGGKQDTLPAWLYRRFNRLAKPWEALTDDDRAYWEHQACAVRRAVARNGFRTESAR